MTTNPAWTAWLVVGFAGQLAFSSRFLVQWIASERLHRSIVPVAFWWLSLAGGALLLAYAVSRKDPVFIVGQASGLIVYSRNLILVRRERAAVGAFSASRSDGPSGRNSPTDS